MKDTSPINQLLESLTPNSAADWTLFQSVLGYAEKLRQRDNGMSLLGGTTVRLIVDRSGAEGDALSFLRQLPETSARYFHGLMEALDIYQSIHGEALPVAEVRLPEKSLRELKQIRDMCLEEGLRSIY